MYWRIPFEWPGGRRPSRGPSLTLLAWRIADDVADLVPLAAEILAASVDASDQAGVRTLGSQGAAERILSPPVGYGWRPEWRQVLVLDDEPVGFVLPVTFDGCVRDGLDEGTIYHMGIDPRRRGRGLGRVLLRRATDILVHHGVWRIYCDTAADNVPMIKVFETEGWQRHPARERPIAVPPTS